MRRLFCSFIALMLLLLPCRSVEGAVLLPAASDGLLSDGNITMLAAQASAGASAQGAALSDGSLNADGGQAQAEEHSPVPSDGSAEADGAQAEDKAVESGGMIFRSYAGAGMFQAGSYSGEQSAAQRQTGFSLRMRSTDPEAALYEAIVTAMQSDGAVEKYDLGAAGEVYALRVDITSLNYSVPANDDDAYDVMEDAIYRVFARAVNDNPDLFYFVPMAHYGLLEREGSLFFQSLYMQVNYDAYSKSDIYKEKKLAMLREAFPDGSSGMSLTEIALALHDYLALQVSYDLDANAAGALGNTTVYKRYPSAFSAYGAIVEKKAVCHGLSLAYKTLLRDLGITAFVVPDYTRRHAWNLVELENGKYYHADLTDAIGIYASGLNRVSHECFLLSDAEQETYYDGIGWKGAKLPEAPSSHPNAAFFRDVGSAMFYMEGQWYYHNGAGALQRSVYGKARKAAAAPAKTSKDAALLADISHPVRIGDRLYFFIREIREDGGTPNTYSAIYAYSPKAGIVTQRSFAIQGEYKNFHAEEDNLCFLLPNDAPWSSYEGADLADVDRNSSVDVRDVLTVLKIVKKNGQFPADDMPKAEVIYDQYINENDAQRIAEMAAKLAI